VTESMGFQSALEAALEHDDIEVNHPVASAVRRPAHQEAGPRLEAGVTESMGFQSALEAALEDDDSEVNQSVGRAGSRSPALLQRTRKRDPGSRPG